MNDEIINNEKVEVLTIAMVARLSVQTVTMCASSSKAVSSEQ